SSTSMNVASVTVRAIIQGVTGGRWYVSDAMDSLRSLHVNFGFHGHSQPQRKVFVLSRLQDNFYRYALNDFDIVTGGVLGRQQAQACATGIGKTIDVSVVASAVSVH